ncbi:MAG: hypothetical protein IJF45_06380, partial [Clostridia bacterium]|nr:hypothetical protein [Clostridia bacterium]
MKKLFLNTLLTILILVGLAISLGITASAEEAPSYVAQIGSNQYESIDDAIAAWTPNSTLTL